MCEELVELSEHTKTQTVEQIKKISCKMLVVDKLLDLIVKKGDKVLIFSLYKKTLSMIEQIVNHKGIKYVRMDGSCDMEERKSAIESFQNDPEITCFLITTKTGGLGLNLVAANKVIVFDPDWNPATDS